MMLLQHNYRLSSIGSAPFGSYIAVAFRKAIDVEWTIWLSDQVRTNRKLPEGLSLLIGYPAQRMTNVCYDKPDRLALHELPQILLGKVAQSLRNEAAVFVPYFRKWDGRDDLEVVLHLRAGGCDA